MTYQVKSAVDFKRMREFFFAKDSYTLSGEGRFTGIFHLFKGGRSLTGDFESDEAGLHMAGATTGFPIWRAARGCRTVRRDRGDYRISTAAPSLKYSSCRSAGRSRRARGSTPCGEISISPVIPTSSRWRDCAWPAMERP